MEISNVILLGWPSTSLGNFHRQNDPKEYFFTAFFAQRKMTMEISNVVLGKSSYHHHVSKS